MKQEGLNLKKSRHTRTNMEQARSLRDQVRNFVNIQKSSPTYCYHERKIGSFFWFTFQPLFGGSLPQTWGFFTFFVKHLIQFRFSIFWSLGALDSWCILEILHGSFRILHFLEFSLKLLLFIYIFFMFISFMLS